MRLRDRDAIRALLETDRVWSAYALADLAPGPFALSEWYGSTSPPAVALLYRAFSVPVLLAVGTEEALRPVFRSLPAEPELYLAVPRHALALLEPRYHAREIKPMLRMWLPPERELPPRDPRVVRLDELDAAEVEELYRDGIEAGEAPEFFAPSMLARGTFRGVREGRGLVAVSGTHVLDDDVSVAAIGNVYVRRSARGRGLGGIVTAATASAIRESGIRTVVLNVGESNAAARRIYASLGFLVHIPYHEGRLELHSNT